jgi:hypothetical protein
MSMRIWFLAMLAASPLLGCHGSSCVRGTSTACTCTDGTSGAQVCNASGAFDACVCGAGSATKKVFITSGTFTGNLKMQGGAPTGLAGADQLCTNAGVGAGLGSTWKAWLSDSSANAIDRINDVGPWFLTNGTRAFNNKANLGSSPLVAIDYDESARLVSPNDPITTERHLVWTGTQAGGMTAKGATCSDWVDGTVSSNGQAGAVDDASQWTSSRVEGCDNGIGQHMHLYCFQQ